ncbi:cardioacceleratory peptide receptor-like isoform X2 [Ruditapes philippinarum]|uniref:cardioacceleratory peptide receptor-like isoform X2 n=1 Tax=Ruditapes philippinarum TaxID=129788 RepID=UPI00295B8531|nr:cardioacceleratory peptide receptor-like isoform X2 [Ruditapes philippinarum]
MATTFLPIAVVNETVSSNHTNSTLDQKLNPFYFYQTEEIVFLSFLFFFIVIGNSIVLLALGLSKRTHSRMHFFIMHLALADLSVGLITVLGDLIWKITIKWYAGDVICKMLKFAQAFVMFASSYMLVALSIDRYDAIARPLSFSTTWTRCKVLVGVAWGLSALFSVPLFVFSGVPEGTLECWLQFPIDYDWIWLVYFVGVMTAVLILPALIIAGCYLLIILIIWKNSHLLETTRPKQVYTAEKKFLVSSSHDIAANNGCTPTGSPKTNRVRSGVSGGRSSKGIIPQAKIRTVKMTFTIVSAFILCWSPYFIFNLLSVLGIIPKTQATIATHTFIQSLAPLNSAANPIIYGIFSTRICRYLRRRDARFSSFTMETKRTIIRRDDN